MKNYEQYTMQELRESIRSLQKTIIFLHGQVTQMRKEKFRREEKKRALKALKVIAK